MPRLTGWGWEANVGNLPTPPNLSQNTSCSRLWSMMPSGKQRKRKNDRQGWRHYRHHLLTTMLIATRIKGAGVRNVWWEEWEKEMDDEIQRWRGKLTEWRFSCSVTMPQFVCFFYFQSMLSGHTCLIEHEGSTWCRSHRTSPRRGATSTQGQCRTQVKKYSHQTSAHCIHIQE